LSSSIDWWCVDDGTCRLVARHFHGQWLKPEIEIISRDRWSEFATAAQKGAPQARQVADCWHLLHNLTESVSTLFPRIRAELNPSGPTSKGKEPSSAQLARKPQYRELLALSEQGLGPEQIAPLMGLSERTVYRWLTQANAPSWQHQARSSSVIDPYHAYLLKRWQEGCRKGSVLCRELNAQGLSWLRTCGVTSTHMSVALPLF